MEISFYKLIGRLPVPCNDAVEWAAWCETANRRVAETQVGPLWVSTVFLGLDHNFSGRGDPLLFETMVFDGDDNRYRVRVSTWDQAQRSHAIAVEDARAQLASANRLLETHD